MPAFFTYLIPLLKLQVFTFKFIPKLPLHMYYVWLLISEILLNVKWDSSVLDEQNSYLCQWYCMNLITEYLKMFQGVHWGEVLLKVRDKYP